MTPDDELLLRQFKSECDKVGIHYDPGFLVQHHRANAALAATFRQMNMDIAIAREDRLREIIERLRHLRTQGVQTIDLPTLIDDLTAIATFVPQ